MMIGRINNNEQLSEPFYHFIHDFFAAKRIKVCYQKQTLFRNIAAHHFLCLVIIGTFISNI